MADWRLLTIADFFSRAVDRDPVLFVGAGASVKSGIPVTGDIVRLGLRWLYAYRNGWEPEDPRIGLSDVQRLLEEQPEYRAGAELADLFPTLIRLLDHPRELRRRFLLHLLSQATEPSIGYVQLASLLRVRSFHTVLTTNFDDLIKVAYGPGGPLITVSKPDEYSVITTAPQYPQIIYLHGQAEYYMDRNLPEEVDHLDPALVNRIEPLVRDHPLIVIGYRGAEPSVMNDLFLDNVERAGSFRHGIYWCVRSSESSTSIKLSPFVEKLAERIGSNFNLVSISDFDSALVTIHQLWEERRSSATAGLHTSHASTGMPINTVGIPFDLRRDQQVTLDDVDLTIAERNLRTYAQRVGLAVPSESSYQWYEQLLLNAGLAQRNSGKVHLTNSGVLLLATEPRDASRGAWVEMRLPKRPPQAIDGTLWQQYDGVLATIDEVNHPLRMKGLQSETIRPYPEDAIKEVIANALVHRDYESSDPIIVSVDSESIRVDSAGGLESSLLRRLLGISYESGATPQVPEDILQRKIEHGERGSILTAYRNPVIADVFYGTGIVDKVGSGLADALEVMQSVGGRLQVSVAPDNTSFSVTLFRRPSRVDAVTGTARPRTPSVWAYTNLFEVLQLPARIYSAPSPWRRTPDPQSVPASRSWPRFVPYDGRIYTFSNLNDPSSALRSQIETADIYEQDLEAFAATLDGQRRLVHLLNEQLFHHLSLRGLRVDWDHKRCYYACPSANVRYAEYSARVRSKARRRVAWWPGKERTHCVHEAAEFQFELFQTQWALRITPAYVFTTDGAKDRIRGPAASALAMQYSKDDYNRQVRDDIFFWRSVLAGAEEQIDLDHSGVVLSAVPLSISVTPATMDAEPGDEVSRTNAAAPRDGDDDAADPSRDRTA